MAGLEEQLSRESDMSEAKSKRSREGLLKKRALFNIATPNGLLIMLIHRRKFGL